MTKDSWPIINFQLHHQHKILSSSLRNHGRFVARFATLFLSAWQISSFGRLQIRKIMQFQLSNMLWGVTLIWRIKCDGLRNFSDRNCNWIHGILKKKTQHAIRFQWKFQDFRVEQLQVVCKANKVFCCLLFDWINFPG